ncbi:DinB family protein [Paramicrobacterium chengjingii]|uniref:DinB family protein n=1 Tax=Paramicrobacterium chengjingii TaxID=2769067 RepID=A0ABX6YHH8_9MICO|nr:DinB family protein [Microbacterium chengjingii]QPZ37832.1 DinB family protein [Microbacterium chengjingii]
MPITPDTKDWTWVLTRPCPECGFDATAIELSEVGSYVRANAGIWADVLERDTVRERPDDSTWSPLEYACHVRDVHSLFAQRLVLAMTHENPVFPDWNQDEAAVQGRYADQALEQVASDLMDAAFAAAEAFDAVPAEAAGRRGRRSDGASFTIETLGRYYVHDIVHHAWDVTRERD